MKKFLFVNALIFMPFCILFSQEYFEVCGTPASYTEKDTSLVAWYGNNDILYEYLDQHKDFFQGYDRLEERGLEDCAKEIRRPFSIPIKFYYWLATGETQESVAGPQQLLELIRGVNEGFANNGFNTNFYMYCPAYIVNDGLVDLAETASTWNLNSGGNFNNYAINVHIVRDAPGWTGLYNGLADNITILRSATPATLIHEIGHYFGLEHTHRFTEDPLCCRAEPVTRGKRSARGCLGQCTSVNFTVNNKRCSRTGDYLCDTDADPNGPENGCVYSGTLVDQYGESFHPDTRNYMSYYGCRSFFSTQQKAIMADGIRNWMYTVDGSVLDPDKYEPDDPEGVVVGSPTLISIGESQCHSMHNALPIVLQTCNDLEDWLRIENKNGFLGSYILTIEDVLDENNPVIDVRIWNTNSDGERSGEIASTISQSGNIRNWLFDCSSITPNTTTDFLVQIVGEGSNTGGVYKVRLTTSIQLPSISGKNQICPGQTYNLLNYPNNAVIVWTGSSNLTFSPNSNGTAITINTAIPFESEYWVNTSITVGGCNYQVKKLFNSYGGALPPIQNISHSVLVGGCDPIFYFSIPNVDGATYYDWSCTSSNSHFTGCVGNGLQAKGFAIHLHEGEQVPITIRVVARNDCGGYVQKSLAFNYVATNCNGGHLQGNEGTREVKISPNPVGTSEMTVEIVDNKPSNTEYQIIITNQFGDIKFITDTIDKINFFNTYLLAEGLYYIQVVAEDGIVSKSFIVQND